MGAIYRSSDETGFGGLFQQGKTTVGSSVLLHIMDNTFVELMTIYHGRDLLEPWDLGELFVILILKLFSTLC
jgi:hypothetical protein